MDGLTALLQWVSTRRQELALEGIRQAPVVPGLQTVKMAGMVLAMDEIEGKIIALISGREEEEDGQEIDERDRENDSTG